VVLDRRRSGLNVLGLNRRQDALLNHRRLRGLTIRRDDMLLVRRRSNGGLEFLLSLEVLRLLIESCCWVDGIFERIESAEMSCADVDMLLDGEGSGLWTSLLLRRVEILLRPI
jgi:hypothetical protein